MLAGAHGPIQVLAIASLTGFTSFLIQAPIRFVHVIWLSTILDSNGLGLTKSSSSSQEKAIPDVDGLMPGQEFRHWQS